MYTRSRERNKLMSSVDALTRMPEPAESEAARALFFMHSSPMQTGHQTLQSQKDQMPSLSLSSSPQQQPKHNSEARTFFTSRQENTIQYGDNMAVASPRSAAGTLCSLMVNRVTDGVGNSNGMHSTNGSSLKIEESRARALSLMSLDTEFDTNMSDVFSSSLPEASFLNLYRNG